MTPAPSAGRPRPEGRSLADADVVVHLGPGPTATRARRPAGGGSTPSTDLADHPGAARRGRRRWASATSVVAVERDGLRRLGQQPGAAHRGGAAATRPGAALRRRPGRDASGWRSSGGPPVGTGPDGRRAPPDGVGRRPSPSSGSPRRRGRPPRCGPSGTDRPAQFLHLDDLACGHRPRPSPRASTGPFNVAPDGWLPRRRAAPSWPARSAASTCRPASRGRLATLRAEIGTSGPPEGVGLHPPRRGSWPTIASGPPAGRRATATRRSTSRPTRAGRWPRSAPAAARSSRWRSPPASWWSAAVGRAWPGLIVAAGCSVGAPVRGWTACRPGWPARRRRRRRGGR